MDTPHNLQPGMIVSVYVYHLKTAGYETGIVRSVDYDNDEFEVEIERGLRIFDSNHIEVPR